MKCVRKFSQRFPLQSILNEKFAYLAVHKPLNQHKLREYSTASLVSPGFFEAAPNLRSSLHVCWLCCWRETCLSMFFRLDFSVGFTVEYTKKTTSHYKNDIILIPSSMKRLANHLCLGVFLFLPLLPLLEVCGAGGSTSCLQAKIYTATTNPVGDGEQHLQGFMNAVYHMICISKYFDICIKYIYISYHKYVMIQF